MSLAKLFIGAAAAALAAAQPAEQESETAAAHPKDIAAAEQVAAGLDWDKLISDQVYAQSILPHMALIERTSKVPEQVEFARNMIAFAFLTLKRYADAAAVSEKLIASNPDEADYRHRAFVSYLGLEQDEKALGTLERAAAAATTPAARMALHEALPQETISYFFVRLLDAKNEAARLRLGEALAQMNWPGDGRPVERDNMRALAARSKLLRGDRTGAAALARQVSDPDALLELIVDRRMDPLFKSDTDRLARMTQAVAAADAATAEALAAEPGDLKRVLSRVQYLRSVGRDAEAVKLVEPTISDMEAVERTGEDAFWVVNEAAYALQQLDRHAEAVALMDKLLALGFDKHPMLVSMNINFIGILNEAGLHQRALDHSLRIAQREAEYANDYGKMWMAEGTVCSLAALGRVADAAPHLERLRASGDTNHAARTRAMLCTGDLDGAERLLIERLASTEATQALQAVQDFTIAGRASPMTRAVEERWRQVIARPAVQQSIARVGRSMKLPLARSYWGRF